MTDYEITLRVRDYTLPPDPQGLKELIAQDFEKYGNVRVVEVRMLGGAWNQMTIGGGEIEREERAQTRSKRR